MGKLYILIGKSASGKDSVYQALIRDPQLRLKPYVGYTTRPVRAGEKHGREYYFSTMEQLEQYRSAGILIEERHYHTVHGEWVYFSVDNDTVDLEKNSYLYIGTLESYIPIRDYYGEDKVIPLYLEIDDGIRLQRALDRERGQAVPKYAEMCRRFLSDAEDFSEENLLAAGIQKRFSNEDLQLCIAQIRAYIMQSKESRIS